MGQCATIAAHVHDKGDSLRLISSIRSFGLKARPAANDVGHRL